MKSFSALSAQAGKSEDQQAMDGHGLSRRVVDDIVSHHRNATVAQQPLATSPQQQINVRIL